MSAINGAGLSRRGFLAGGALLGAWLAPTGMAHASTRTADNAVLNSSRPDAPYEMNQAENHIMSSCLQCNTGCGIRAKLQNGVVTVIDGNPYNPWTLMPHLPFATAVVDAAPVDGSLCPKGQSGLQTAYDPYRIRKVLKRAGKRGSNTWVSIPFEQAVEEICEGGALFADVEGEQTRQVEGLRSLTPMKDVDLSKAMGVDIKAIWDEKDPVAKQALVDTFKVTYAANLDMMIDPDHPDLGPKNNQVVVAWGRLKAGRSELYKRFSNGLGTTNAHGHTTVCQGSLYFTCKAISDQYIGGKFTDGKKFYWQVDTENSEFVLFVGANLFEGNYGPPNRALRLTENLTSGKTKIAVADPRFGALASKAWKWLPVKPGTDGALAMGFIRWMFDNERYDTAFLSAANKAAAVAVGEPSWTNSTLLVDVETGTFVRAAELLVDGEPLRAAETRPYVDPKTKEEKEYDEPFMVVMVNGVPTAVDINDAENAVVGDLFVSTTLPDGRQVKTGLQILKDDAETRTVAEWAEVVGIAEKDIVDVVTELTSHGKKAGVDVHRGVAQHTNGFYNVLGWMTVNMLLGNYDHKGGMITLSVYDVLGTDKGELFDVQDQPGKISAFGISSIRHDIDYEKTTLFDGYPAKRNWYPLASDIYEEILPSISDAYPYPVKALFTYMAAPTYSLPAGDTNIKILSNVDQLPLHVACDILVGPTSMYADYIFPDLSYLERWEFQGSHMSMNLKVQPVRQPVIAPIPQETTVYGQAYPISFETMILGIAERLELPGFGTDGFGPGLDMKHPDDLYLRQVANLAFGESPDGEKAVPSADDQEREIFLAARSHLPKSIFDPERWERIVGSEQWGRVIYVLNRGGRFQDDVQDPATDIVLNPWGKLLNLYQEKTAKTIASGTGKHNPGYATYKPIADYLGNEPTAYRDGYDLAMITHRIISQTKSRTIADPWLAALMPSNGILINKADLDRLGLEDGQDVRVVSATNTTGEWDLGAAGVKPMIGKTIATQRMRPGVVSFALGYGHWATGASDIVIDGFTVRAEKRRSNGIHANAAMWTDPTITNTCMFDPVGGSVSFYDTYIRLEPV